MLDLLDGDAAKLADLERRVAEHLGFSGVLTSVGQVYPRSLDFDVRRARWSSWPPAPSSLATTIRLMAGAELATEGFQPGQVGSSAMPHKMNSRSAERINGMLVLLRGYAGMAGELAGSQWNEGDVSDSVVRRVALPDAFFALDGLYRDHADGARRVRRLPGRHRARAGPLPALPRHHRRADGRGARRRRPGDRARGDQGARRGRRAGDAGEGPGRRTTSSPGSPATSGSACPPARSTGCSPTRCGSPAPPPPRWPRSSRACGRSSTPTRTAAAYTPGAIL